MKPSHRVHHLKKNYEALILIHLSCQTRGDDNEGYSPRITSIVTLKIANESTTSFSMHSVAEEMNIGRDEITKHYEKIELEMLERFFAYVKANANAYWVHWNMRNISFGFQAIEHRYRVLAKKAPPEISEEKRINLPSVVRKIYGSEFAPHPRMYSLMELNGGRHRHVLDGKSEVAYFEEQKFFEMHQSTIAKVSFFNVVVHKLLTGKLKTKTKKTRYVVNELVSHPIMLFLSLVAIFFTVYQASTYFYEAIKNLF